MTRLHAALCARLRVYITSPAEDYYVTIELSLQTLDTAHTHTQSYNGRQQQSRTCKLEIAINIHTAYCSAEPLTHGTTQPTGRQTSTRWACAPVCPSAVHFLAYSSSHSAGFSSKEGFSAVPPSQRVITGSLAIEHIIISLRSIVSFVCQVWVTNCSVKSSITLLRFHLLPYSPCPDHLDTLGRSDQHRRRVERQNPSECAREGVTNEQKSVKVFM